MTQTVIMVRDGTPYTITLPKLSIEQIKELGGKLDMVRASCVMSQRSAKGTHYHLVRNRYINYGSSLYFFANRMKMGTDYRKEIVELEDDVFNRFILLLADVAQDDHRVFKMYGEILKDFGLI